MGIFDLQMLRVVPSLLGSEGSGEESGLDGGWGGQGRGAGGGAVLCHLSQQKGSPHKSASAVEESAFCSLSANL